MKKIILLGLAFVPFAAFAAKNIADIVLQVNAIINTLVPFIVGLAVLTIIWGLFNYVAGAGDEEKRAQAKQYIIWGIIGVFLMLSVWGLVNVLVNSFSLENTTRPAVPTFGTGTLAPGTAGTIQ